MIEIVLATMDHVAAMAPRMRAADVAEVRALGHEPAEALAHSMASSFIAETALIDGEPAAMWGAASEPQDWSVAILWMLGTDLVPRRGRDVLRHSRPFVDRMQVRFPLLRCVVHEKHTQSRRWLLWLGFRERLPVEIAGNLFYLCDRSA